LYEESVQSPAADVDFIIGVFRRRRKRSPETLCEHFCGSAALSAAWVVKDRTRRATGVDLDARALEYARRAHVEALGSEGARLRLEQRDVRARPRSRADVVVAYNFSYCTFQDRVALGAYFRAARATLRPGGMFFIDVFGGITAQQPSIEPHARIGHTYVWEQSSFDPLSNRLIAYIHFFMEDGTAIKRAFRYDWRLWQIVELRELLEEVGFTRSDVYWEDRTRDRERTGRFRRRTRVESEPSWTAYIVAER
jgi:SAM-dependent methyltransferase